jgi:hypothetical protein
VRPYLIRILLWTGLLASICSAITAQDSSKTAAIVIEVKDPSGGFISGAQVQITPSPSNNAKNLITDFNGTLHIDLSPGIYDLSVASPGFAQAKGRLEVQNAAPRLVSFVLQVGFCTGYCPHFEEVPLQWVRSRAISPDQRYAIIENDDLMGRYAYFLEDRHLNTRRELFTYNKRLFFLWNPDSKVFAVTGYTGSDVSRCTIVAVDEMIRPIPVLDLFAHQLPEIEREELEGRLTNRHTNVKALRWNTRTDLILEVYGYADADHSTFTDTYTLPVDLHPNAAAPIWPK